MELDLANFNWALQATLDVRVLPFLKAKNKARLFRLRQWGERLSLRVKVRTLLYAWQMSLLSLSRVIPDSFDQLVVDFVNRNRGLSTHNLLAKGDIPGAIDRSGNG